MKKHLIKLLKYLHLYKILRKLIYNYPPPPPYKVDIKLSHEWYGNNYGGFFVHPDLLDKDSIVYSFGIGTDISFDTDIIERHGCNVFGFDPTPQSIAWVKHNSIPKFTFYDFGIASTTGTMAMYLPLDPEVEVSCSRFSHDLVSNNVIRVSMKRMADIMQILSHKHIDLLKMDIEGDEYEVLADILEARVPIVQITVEFHGRFFPTESKKTQHAIALLKKHGFKLFAFHAGYAQELSFINIHVLNKKKQIDSTNVFMIE